MKLEEELTRERRVDCELGLEGELRRELEVGGMRAVLEGRKTEVDAQISLRDE